MRLNRNEDAVSDLQVAAKASPEEPTIHFFLARAYRTLGRTQESQAELEIFKKLDETARAATADRAQQVMQNSKDNPH
jgi:predicted Zn-dependent protease